MFRMFRILLPLVTTIFRCLHARRTLLLENLVLRQLAVLKRKHSPWAEGQPSQSLMAAIADRERELREITDKLLEPRPGSLRETLDELRKFATERLVNLRRLISHPESVHHARAVMAEQFGKLTLTPIRENGALSYAARGKVDFFGEQAMIRVGGAGGQNRTGYARLFRAALYH
jgi:hypothetical protein